MAQIITPYLLYEDAAAAMDFLSTAFGFAETMRMADDDGRVSHGEMAMGDGRVFLGQPEDDFRNPRHLGARVALVYVYVPDVDDHCERARAAGAEIVEKPADQEYGERRYHARDPEGYDWYFAAPLG